MSAVSLGSVYGANNALIPKGGPKVVAARLDFSDVEEILIDGQQIVSQNHIEYLQGMYVDNGNNANAITFTMATTNQRIIVPANTQGYYTILVPNNPRIVANSLQQNGNIKRVLFYNVPIQSQTWSTI